MRKWQPNKTIKLLPALALTFGVVAPISASASIVEECIVDQCTITFGYTGQIESITLPTNATNVRFEALGAQGGKTGGSGGRVTGTFIETPQTLYVRVGGAGGSSPSAPGGFNGGGPALESSGMGGSGGGASDIRIGASLSTRVVVAGGGGGRGSGLGSGGGAGGGLVGAKGRTGQGSGGLGGSQFLGGLGGATNGQGTPGSAGVLGIGGIGGSGPLHGGGGGGGGYYGGGGGGADANSCCIDAGGGGGGSSYTDPELVTDVIHSQGVRIGAGQITISYQLIIEIEPTPPTVEPTSPPVEEPVTAPTMEPTSPPVQQPDPPVEEPVTAPTVEPTTPPVEEPVTTPTVEPTPPPVEEPDPPVEEPVTPPTEDLTAPNPSEPESVNSVPLDSKPPVIAQPQPMYAPFELPATFEAVLTPAPVEGFTAPITTGMFASQPRGNRIDETRSAVDDSLTTPAPQEQDEILQQPSDLRQAAQTVVVPAQNNQRPWSQNSLFAGLIGLGIFALIAGLVVARRGVPGAIAS